MTESVTSGGILKNPANSINLSLYRSNDTTLEYNEDFMENDGVRCTVPRTTMITTPYFKEGQFNGITLIEIYFNQLGMMFSYDVFNFKIYRRNPETLEETLTYFKPSKWGSDTSALLDPRDRNSYYVVFENNMEYKFEIETTEYVSTTYYLELDEIVFTPIPRDILLIPQTTAITWDNLLDVLNGKSKLINIMEQGIIGISGDGVNRTKTTRVTLNNIYTGPVLSWTDSEEPTKSATSVNVFGVYNQIDVSLTNLDNAGWSGGYNVKYWTVGFIEIKVV